MAMSNGHGELAEVRDHTRVVLQPIAAPSILGLFGFAGATFIVAAHAAGWYGGERSPEFLFPFAAMFGGLAQFLAGMWAFKARDGIATAMHGMWGSFWLAYGLLNLLVAIGVYTLPTGAFPELGFWFLALAVITALGALAAVAENLGLTTVLTSLAVGAGFFALHYLTGEGWWETAGGWILVGSAVAATYTAGAMMLESAWGRVVLPLGKVGREANIPGTRITQPIQFEHQEPGVRMGQ
ncbi:MAG: acetate uptake transporter family protein [Solirubrobacterales bacterium]